MCALVSIPSARELADILIGFANAEGGTVVVGLWNGVVEGIDRQGSGRLSGWQQAVIDFTAPPIPHGTRIVDCRNAQGDRDRLLVFEVEVSQQVHANRKEEVFLRVGDENRRLTFSQRQELLYDKGQASYEITPVDSATLDDLDRALLVSYAEAVNHPEPERLLDARGLLPVPGVSPWRPCCSSGIIRSAGSPRRPFACSATGVPSVVPEPVSNCFPTSASRGRSLGYSVRLGGQSPTLSPRDVPLPQTDGLSGYH